VAILTSGIYTPTTVTIRCDDANRAEVELDDGEVMTILTAPSFLDRVEEVVPVHIDEAQAGARALQQDSQE